MSFSGNIKEEISRQLSPARHCQIAELAAIISMCGAVMIDSRGHAALKIHTENLAVARKSFTLLRRTFNIVVDIAIRVNREKGSSYYYIVVKKHEDAIRVLQAAKLLNPYGDVEEELSVVKNVVIQETCCKRAFLRGVFLASGSMSDPEKSYHFEIVCASMGKAQQIQKIMRCFFIPFSKSIHSNDFKKIWIEGSYIIILSLKSTCSINSRK